MVRNPPLGPDGHEISMVGVDCAIIMNPKVWEASGHVGGFSDPMVDCAECKRRYRADQLGLVGFYDMVPDSAGVDQLMLQMKPKVWVTVESESERDRVSLSNAQKRHFSSEPKKGYLSLASVGYGKPSFF